MKLIYLPTGEEIKVSDEDYDRVIQFPWSRQAFGRARARLSKWRGGNGKSMQLHRFIMDAKPGQIVDHIDGDPLNCQRENLQFITQARNMMKSSRAKASTGVYKSGNGWCARCRVDGKFLYLGSYPDEASAIAAVKARRDQAWSAAENPNGYKFG